MALTLQTQAITLDAQDSDLTIRGVDGAKPLFIGAPVVTGFVPHEGMIVKADVSKLVTKGSRYRGAARWRARDPRPVAEL